MAAFRIPIAIRNGKKKTAIPREKMYSCHEVEKILFNAIATLDMLRIIKKNDIDMQCSYDYADGSVIVSVRQGDRVSVYPLWKGDE